MFNILFSIFVYGAIGFMLLIAALFLASAIYASFTKNDNYMIDDY